MSDAISFFSSLTKVVHNFYPTFLDASLSFVYNYKPANFKEDFISALTALVTSQDDPQRLKELTEGTKLILNDYQKELPEVLKKVRIEKKNTFIISSSPKLGILQVMQSCDEDGMFLEGYWYGKKHACSDLFKLRPSDGGFCCSFNTLAMEEQL